MAESETPTDFERCPYPCANRIQHARYCIPVSATPGEGDRERTLAEKKVAEVEALCDEAARAGHSQFVYISDLRVALADPEADR